MTTAKYTKGLLAFAMAGFIAACAPQEEEAASPSGPAAGGNSDNEAAESTATESTAAESTENGVTIEIEGDDTMSFDVTGFTVEAGASVTLVFKNVGRLPKESMGHNVVVLEMGIEALDFASAAQLHRGNDYMPPERENEVIAATSILGPGESETITFNAPEEPGEYEYLCTFPAHATAGMVGVMTVE